MTKALVIIGIIVIFVIAFSAGNKDGKESSVTPTMTQKQEQFSGFSDSGTNNKATQAFKLPKGLRTFKMTHQGISNFSVWLLDEKGAKVELVANELGDFEGSKAVGITKEGEYILDVDADGPWTIKIE